MPFRRQLRLVPWTEASGGCACAVHRDRRSSASCDRCGALACPVCLMEAVDGRLLCRACGPKHHESLLPWDCVGGGLGDLAKGFARSVGRLLSRPARTFREASPGRGRVPRADL